MLSRLRIIVVLLLFGSTWYVLQASGQVQFVPIKKSLSSFPERIGSYRLSDSFQSSAEVLELLGVDDYIQYNYLAEDGFRINLYVGYYRAVGVSGSYHSPKNCLPGGGWGISATREVVIKTGQDGRQEQISEMLIRNGSEFQIVMYWYQNRGRIIASEYWEKIYLVWDAVLKGRRDGSFVRIMALPGENGTRDMTRERVQRFSGQVMTELENFLPGVDL